MSLHLVVMGASLGALEALRVLLPGLLEDFSSALIIVLHRDKEESGNLLPLLDTNCVLPIGFPVDKEPILAGRVYIAPPNYHLLIEGDHFAYSMDEPEDNARPSINVLFDSAAETYGANVTGIVLTGMLQDGARGLAAIHRHGGAAVVQTPHDALAPSMPLAALEAVPSAQVLTLVEIGKFLAKMTH
ncbi:MAG: chemotaxis protein CheB [Candidatus Planktophila sp.]|nr:chemotaxis protein CheB [Candidatus Planktophila sp.]